MKSAFRTPLCSKRWQTGIVRWSAAAACLLGAPSAALAEQTHGMPRKDGTVDLEETVPAADGKPRTEPPATATKAAGRDQARTSLPVKVSLPKATSTPVKYPPEAQESASVLLEITVGLDGRATQPQKIEGREPFASAAMNAVGDWRFVPATRDGTPVVARIRFLVRFEPPVSEPEAHREAHQEAKTKPSPPDAKAQKVPATKAPGHPTSADQVTPVEAKPGQLEVTITGERPEAAVVSMGRADVEQMPGAFGDPFRAIDVLPGVTPIVSGLPFFFIRGAPPGNQGYFLDGIRVPLLYHMAAGPGVIHPALVDRVDLYAGGYPARYGRYAGAIVAGESRDPLPEYHAQGTVRLVDSGGYVTAPLGRGVVALGGRYSYTGAVVSLIAPQVKIAYWDYQAKAVQYLTDKDTLGVFAFGALDLVEDKTSNSPQALVGTEFHRFDLRYKRRISEATALRTAVTVGLDKTLAGAVMTVRDRLVAARSDLDHHFSEHFGVRAGFDATVDAYDVLIPIPDGSNVRLRRALPERNDYAAGIWTDFPMEPTRGVTLVPGLRLDHYWSGDATALAIEPRGSAIFEIRKSLRLVHAIGLAHQPPSFVVPIPGFQLSGLREGLQRSVQSSSGVELDLPADITASTTLFQNAFFNLTDQLSAINRPNNNGNDELIPTTRARGRTFGAELLIRRSFSQRVGFLLAYTLSKSWRTVEGLRMPAAFDRRHVLQAAIAFNLGRNWRASTRAVIYSGIPSRYENWNGDSSYNLGASGSTARTNPEYLPRTPAYWRLDWRLQKRWLVGQKGAYWAATFEVLNTTINLEAVSQSCSANACRAEKIGPITIPSIGVEAAY